jgi:SRSO17 transposase
LHAEAAGDPGPWRQQAVLGRSSWDADALRDVVRDHALGALAEPDATLVIDETGFLKQGKTSCGVRRQYTGTSGKITNCQVGVFAAYVSSKGHALVDRRLYLPRDWTSNRERLEKAHVPAGVRFATKPAIAAGMTRRAIEAGVPFALGCQRQPLLQRRIGQRPMGGGRRGLGGGRAGDGAASCRQGLRARRRGVSPVQLVGQTGA